MIAVGRRESPRAVRAGFENPDNARSFFLLVPTIVAIARVRGVLRRVKATITSLRRLYSSLDYVLGGKIRGEKNCVSGFLCAANEIENGSKRDTSRSLEDLENPDYVPRRRSRDGCLM